MRTDLAAFGLGGRAFILLGAALCLIGFFAYSALKTRVVEIDRRMLEMSNLEIGLNRELGYGGLIHNFKNYVLRGEDGYRVSAEANVEAARAIVERIDGLTGGAAGRDLEPVLDMAARYERSIATVSSARERGLSPDAVDRLVRVDDGPALLALMEFFHRQHDRDVADRRRAGDLQSLILAGLALWLALAVALQTVFMRWAARQASPAQAASD